MQIQVRINEEGALRNQRFAFTDRFTLVSELLQNARRAGATSIAINHDAEAGTLTIRDNGRGMGRMQVTRLNRCFHGDEVNTGEGIGLDNAALRIRSYYDGGARVIFRSWEGVGTVVALILPRAECRHPAVP